MSDLVDWLRRLVEAEELPACAAVIGSLFSSVVGSAPVMHDSHLLWNGGGPTKVLLLGHYDTVWPIGTVARWPFSVDGDQVTGPGAFDMKAGIVQMVFAMASLPSLEGVTALLTSDEETGSLSSRTLIQETAQGALAALVLEPSAGGALKSARKGTGMYTLRVDGKASHAGLEPEKGINALVGLASVVLAISSIGTPLRVPRSRPQSHPRGRPPTWFPRLRRWRWTSGSGLRRKANGSMPPCGRSRPASRARSCRSREG